jgi:predicted unusual protein kinase regulating ubiquinone biosynthesis (AarF/ABC1/UbiB family)
MLGDSIEFKVPSVRPELSTPRILAMTFVAGSPIESLTGAPQHTRNRVMTSLVALVLRELFEFGLMQTDPNFANYRYQPERSHGAGG